MSTLRPLRLESLNRFQTLIPANRLHIYRNLPKLAPTLPIRRYVADHAHSETAGKESSQKQQQNKKRKAGHDVWSDMSLGERVIHGLQSMSYSAILLLGVGVLGTAIYYLSLDLFSSNDAWRAYDDALEKVMNDETVQKVIGIPMKGETGEGRGTRGKMLNHHIIESPIAPKTLVLRFHVHGPKAFGIVHTESIPDPETGKWVDQLILVDIPSTGRQILVVDNRPTIGAPQQGKTGWFGFGSNRRVWRV